MIPEHGVAPRRAALMREAFRHLGPGFLVTMGFIDPGNWATNVVAGSRYGYALLWVVLLSTVLLGILQHAAARLGLAAGSSLAASATRHFPRPVTALLLATALGATAATAFAEILGAAIGLEMLTGLPLRLGVLSSAAAVVVLLLASHYQRLERYTVAFVSIVGLTFLVELALTGVSWRAALAGTAVPRLPPGSLPTVAAVLGAVVMPHGIFLHSEVVQSRARHAAASGVPQSRRLAFAAADTGAAMVVGGAINAAMVVVSAAVFHARGVPVVELPQAHAALEPALGAAAAALFALALVLAGVASAVTAGMAGGVIVAGARGQAFVTSERSSRLGMVGVIVAALGGALLVREPFQALIESQIVLGVQLPLTVGALLALTSSRRVMGAQVSPPRQRALLWSAAAVVVSLDLSLLWDALWGAG
jgi:manganese transport protein